MLEKINIPTNFLLNTSLSLGAKGVACVMKAYAPKDRFDELEARNECKISDSLWRKYKIELKKMGYLTDEVVCENERTYTYYRICFK